MLSGWLNLEFINKYASLPVQLFFLYFGLHRVGLVLSAETRAVIGLTFLGGSYMAEAFHSGLGSVELSQLESAQGLGLSKWLTMSRIVFTFWGTAKMGDLVRGALISIPRRRYALRVLIDMAEHQADGVIPLKEVAKRQEISEKYLEAILKTLVKNGVITGTRGKGGGYRFNRPAAQVVTAIAEVAGAPQTARDRLTMRSRSSRVVSLIKMDFISMTSSFAFTGSIK